MLTAMFCCFFKDGFGSVSLPKLFSVPSCVMEQFHGVLSPHPLLQSFLNGKKGGVLVAL